MRKLILALCLAALPVAAQVRVTLLHFSDYHSHALPFYSDEGERGGIARAVAYLRHEKRGGALVFSGGDMINKGAPAWSDEYGCADWPWLNGIVDAMAFGNHDADYGFSTFTKCRDAVSYPILSANTNGFRGYAVFAVHGARVGVFAVAGNDFPQLVKVPELTFGDSVAAARETVRALREVEHVDAVVMIGHEHVEADYALAKSVAGIDLIFGSHTHLKRELTRIPETSTWFISPWQYLGYISRVELTINDHRVTDVRGALVPVDARMREDRSTRRRVRKMERALEKKHRELFTTITTLRAPLDMHALAAKTLQAMRDAAGADVALSTESSFRLPLPAGPLTMELLRGALPYDNEIVVCTMSGAQLRALAPDVLTSGADALDPAKQYRVATTDYLANRDAFTCEGTKKRVRAELRTRL